MKKIVLNLPYCHDVSSETIMNQLMVFKINDSNRKQVESFVLNYVNGEIIPLDKAFVVSLSDNNNFRIIGIFCFLETDLRYVATFKEKPDFNKKINFNELSHFIIDEKIMNAKALSIILRRIIPSIITKEEIDEVIWFKYGEFYNRMVEKIYKQYPNFTYYYINEADYFAEKLMLIHSRMNKC